MRSAPTVASTLLLTVLLALVAAFAITARADGHAEELSEQLAAGKLLFEETAGGVGCAYCHGLDGNGRGTAGVEATRIVGAQEAALHSSLDGAVPMMTFISLTEDEFQAVLAYLQHLAELEGEAAADAVDDAGSDE